MEYLLQLKAFTTYHRGQFTSIIEERNLDILSSS
uniref:Uncharacterized protein n=1 Tax=Rhizophora mucronata TaxID=61149 RepID=A0A2P2QN66_RHIMU